MLASRVDGRQCEPWRHRNRRTDDDFIYSFVLAWLSAIRTGSSSGAANSDEFTIAYEMH